MKRKFKFSNLGTYAILTFWSFVVLFPIWTMIINSFKPKRDIFRDPILAA